MNVSLREAGVATEKGQCIFSEIWSWPRGNATRHPLEKMSWSYYYYYYYYPTITFSCFLFVCWPNLRSAEFIWVTGSRLVVIFCTSCYYVNVIGSVLWVAKNPETFSPDVDTNSSDSIHFRPRTRQIWLYFCGSWSRYSCIVYRVVSCITSSLFQGKKIPLMLR